MYCCKKKNILANLGPMFYFLFLKIRKEIQENDILTKMKLSLFSNSLKKLKELFDLITSKISSDGGDFPCIIDIALLFYTSINKCKKLFSDSRMLFYAQYI